MTLHLHPMCPAMSDWETIEEAIIRARKYVYISTMVGQKEHTLMDELKDVLGLLLHTRPVIWVYPTVAVFEGLFLYDDHYERS